MHVISVVNTIMHTLTVVSFTVVRYKIIYSILCHSVLPILTWNVL